MHPNLIVIYTDRLDACHAFYTDLGLTLAKEQHSTGPEHYAAELEGGAVFELYPTSARRPATGSLRLGFTLPARAGATDAAPGRRTLTDPDGRTVVLTIPEQPMATQQEARDAIRHAFGDTAHAKVTAYPAGNVSITLTRGEHTATIQGHPENGWGWSVDPADDAGFTGHDNTTATLNEALAGVRAALN
ncbi:glyoxalase/bleomycin resistance/dioxygenase family protein [Streptomyces sp. NBC_01511]|uniref:VOC family protein n=1 Tax=Streptomyces sp. NBC_01511 TaxID=2903889 RepID=UPI00386FF5DC